MAQQTITQPTGAAAPAAATAPQFPDAFGTGLDGDGRRLVDAAWGVLRPDARDTALERARILRSLGVSDARSLAVVCLCTAFETAPALDPALGRRFDDDVLRLVQGVRQMDAISAHSHAVHDQGRSRPSADNLRKMLIAMVDDVRVVLIRLASQLERLRSRRSVPAGGDDPLARETLEVFAPLANRLGVWQLKWELEDLAFRSLQPAVYRDLAAQLAEKRRDREQFIDAFVAELGAALAEAGIRAEIAGRPKHIYSIWRKMRRKALDFEQIYDVRGVRVLVDDLGACYSALGIVHTRFAHVPGEFDDFIATPKENGYQSIHTAVIGPSGKIVEVQIRTFRMHEENEYGIAAHWRYKERARGDIAVDDKIAWLRRLLEWKDEVSDGDELLEQFRNEVTVDRVYVFTPRGKVIDLPHGSTPIDFAYAVHTQVGHRCRGAKVNGRIVPLNHRLGNGEQVEILTDKNGHPSRDWLNPGLGYLKTARARQRVQRWFKEADFDRHVGDGRAALERELRRLGAEDTNIDRLAAEQGYRRAEDLLASIGSGDLRLSQAVAGLRPEPGPAERVRQRRAPRRAGRDGGMVVEGVGNLLTHAARCCNPIPGDAIAGFITQGRGVTIHRADCVNVVASRARAPHRLIDVAWGRRSADTRYPVSVRVDGYDRKGLLHDLTAVFSNAGLNLLAVELRTDERRQSAHVRMTVEVEDVDRLNRTLAQLGGVAGVTRVRRVRE